MGRPQTEDTKIKISESLKSSGKRFQPDNKGRKFVHYYCQNCKVELERRGVKFCAECRKGKLGGYREGSGRAKSGYYKGTYCGSSYELVWMIHRIDKGLQFSRFSGVLEDDAIKYIPDFLVGNTIIEIKGFEDKDLVNAKTKLAELNGYEVVVLYKEDLKEQFDWVKDNYSYKNVWELYDDYKPENVYNCSGCGSEFTRDRKAKTENVYCSRSCGGKYKKRKPHSLCVDGIETHTVLQTIADECERSTPVS